MESSISSAPVRRLFANTGGIDKDIVASSTLNSSLSARDFPLSFFCASFTSASFFYRFGEGPPLASTTCLRFFVLCDELVSGVRNIWMQNCRKVRECKNMKPEPKRFVLNNSERKEFLKVDA